MVEAIVELRQEFGFGQRSIGASGNGCYSFMKLGTVGKGYLDFHRHQPRIVLINLGYDDFVG